MNLLMMFLGVAILYVPTATTKGGSNDLSNAQNGLVETQPKDRVLSRQRTITIPLEIYRSVEADVLRKQALGEQDRRRKEILFLEKMHGNDVKTRPGVFQLVPTDGGIQVSDLMQIFEVQCAMVQSNSSVLNVVCLVQMNVEMYHVCARTAQTGGSHCTMILICRYAHPVNSSHADVNFCPYDTFRRSFGLCPLA